MTPPTLAVLGCGSWGSTLAAMLARKGLSMRLWGPDEAELSRLATDRHPPGVPELLLPDSISLSTDLGATLAGVDALVLVIPAQVTAGLCDRIAALGAAPPVAIIASKGIDLHELRPLSEIVAERLPDTRVAVVSGPCIAREVARGIPTSVVAACNDPATCRLVQEWFNAPAFRVYRQGDVLGVELAGAYKNSIAIAAGIGDGLGFGANSKAALMSRGLAEMRRFALRRGASDLAIMGLAGIGDLAVTCFSPHSRNRRFGELLARGMAAADAFAEIGEVVEGAPTAEAIVRLVGNDEDEVPIAAAVNDLVHGRVSAREAVERLMSRELKQEF